MKRATEKSLEYCNVCSLLCYRASDTTTTTTTTTATDNDKTSLGQALKTLLEQAASQGRVTCSLTSCVELLAKRPDDVMLCVMPNLTQPDAAATIQSTLIRAVCQEHCIRVLSVDCDVKLAKAVCTAPGDSDVEVGGAAGVREEKVEVNRNKRRMVVRKPSVCSDDAMLITGCDNLAPVMGFPCVLVQVSLGFEIT